MDDLINRKAAYTTLTDYYHHTTEMQHKALREALERVPSAETHEKRTETHACDCISRKEAIDIERNATVDTNPSHFVAHQKFTQFLDDAEISSFGRWQWSNGFNTALTAVGIDLKKLPSAQPEVLACGEGELIAQPEDICSECDAWNVYKNYAQPEIIRCKDCKFNVSRNHKCLQPDSFFLVTEDDFYCGYAERRTDDPD